MFWNSLLNVILITESISNTGICNLTVHSILERKKLFNYSIWKWLQVEVWDRSFQEKVLLAYRYLGNSKPDKMPELNF